MVITLPIYIVGVVSAFVCIWHRPYWTIDVTINDGQWVQDVKMLDRFLGCGTTDDDFKAHTCRLAGDGSFTGLVQPDGNVQCTAWKNPPSRETGVCKIILWTTRFANAKWEFFTFKVGEVVAGCFAGQCMTVTCINAAMHVPIEHYKMQRQLCRFVDIDSHNPPTIRSDIVAGAPLETICYLEAPSSPPNHNV